MSKNTEVKSFAQAEQIHQKSQEFFVGTNPRPFPQKTGKYAVGLRSSHEKIIASWVNRLRYNADSHDGIRRHWQVLRDTDQTNAAQITQAFGFTDQPTGYQPDPEIGATFLQF